VCQILVLSLLVESCAVQCTTHLISCNLALHCISICSLSFDDEQINLTFAHLMGFYWTHVKLKLSWLALGCNRNIIFCQVDLKYVFGFTCQCYLLKELSIFMFYSQRLTKLFATDEIHAIYRSRVMSKNYKTMIGRSMPLTVISRCHEFQVLIPAVPLFQHFISLGKKFAHICSGQLSRLP